MTDNPVVKRYLAEVRAALTSASPADVDDIISELANHIAEAAHTGRDYGDILESLGPARTLAKGYEVELLLNRDNSGGRLDQLFRVAGVIATLSLPTIIITTILATVGTVFTAVGISVFIAALADPILPATLLPPDFKRELGLIWGLPLCAAGLLSLSVLVLYVRFLLHVLRAVARGGPININRPLLPRWLRRGRATAHEKAPQP